MELLHGSPTDPTGRSERELRSYALLDRLGIEFDRIFSFPDCIQRDGRSRGVTRTGDVVSNGRGRGGGEAFHGLHRGI